MAYPLEQFGFFTVRKNLISNADIKTVNLINKYSDKNTFNGILQRHPLQMDRVKTYTIRAKPTRTPHLNATTTASNYMPRI